MAAESFERGREGEEAARGYLVERGWTILDRNWRDGPREIDIVARRGEVLAFVEVKTRGGQTLGSPLESITRRKRREVERAASAWLRSRGGARRTEGVRTTFVRFDAVVVSLDGRADPQVRHVADAWRPGWS